MIRGTEFMNKLWNRVVIATTICMVVACIWLIVKVSELINYLENDHGT